jgi:trk system potassium uptake protein
MRRDPVARYPRTLRRTSRFEIPLEPEKRRRATFQIRSLPLILIGGFALVILIGTLLLIPPWASQEREWTSPAVAIFVATSAVCVTGLVPVDTATHWSGLGEGIILVLIQFGGLGFMTSTTLLFLVFGWRVGIRERLFLSESLDLSRMGGVVALTKRAVIFTVSLEAIGFIILSTRFALDEPLGRALWWGLFHSVSAFNNAGFDLMGNFESLTEHRDGVILGTISMLVVVGGIGYLVVEDIVQRRRASLSLDSRLVLRTTAFLLALGFIVFAAFEWNSTLGGLSTPDKLLQSGFHAVTPRTAGFNSLPIAEMKDETRFFTMGLMFIGGGSGSTAGGIKVGTLAIILAVALSSLRGRESIEAGGREIRRTEADRALTVALLAAFLVFSVSILLAVLQEHRFLDLLFEATSAFGTVGLSTGITPQLNDVSLLIVAAAMFVGRLGPLTLVLALLQWSRPQRRRLPEERVRVG